jgi:hypothetical protein
MAGANRRVVFGVALLLLAAPAAVGQFSTPPPPKPAGGGGGPYVPNVPNITPPNIQQYTIRTPDPAQQRAIAQQSAEATKNVEATVGAFAQVGNMIVVFAAVAAGVAAVTLGAQAVLRMKKTDDPMALAVSDPWIAARLRGDDRESPPSDGPKPWAGKVDTRQTED